jgi:hypothetical protein
VVEQTFRANQLPPSCFFPRLGLASFLPYVFLYSLSVSRRCRAHWHPSSYHAVRTLLWRSSQEILWFEVVSEHRDLRRNRQVNRTPPPQVTHLAERCSGTQRRRHRLSPGILGQWSSTHGTRAPGGVRKSYINQNETQEPLEPWTSSDPHSHEDSSPNWSTGMPERNSVISLTGQNHINDCYNVVLLC